MERQATSDQPGSVTLRDVTEEDLLIFFEHQRDPAATQMAAFPARDRPAFMAHWAKVLRDPANITQTILCDGQVAGNIASFDQAGERAVGYWIGRQFWGRGVATRALAALLGIVHERPLYGYVAKHNIASRRVLEKCGFRVIGEDRGLPGHEVEEWVLRLDSPAQPSAADTPSAG